MASAVVQAIGHYGTHGFSASFDFLDAVEHSSTPADNSEPLRILLVHPGDIRHIITTVSRRRRHNGPESQLRPVHFYVLENPIEILARELLLLEVLNDYEVPIRQRANVFLEIFGNCKVQDRTSRYIEQLGHLLRKLVTNGTGKLEDIVDLSLLRYRERDELEAVFKRYSRAVPFDMINLRDHRMRGYYAERYDNRKALADWDYYESIRGTASIIHIRQFKDWRDTGVAFEFGDQTYTDPNRTMMSYAEGVMKKGKDQGMKKEVLGYWGDIVASPYFSFGVDCETPNKHAEGLFEILNKNTGTEQHRHHAVEVAVYNMLSYLWEIETGTAYKMMKEHDIFSGLGSEAPKAAKKAQSEATKSGNQEQELGEQKDQQPPNDIVKVEADIDTGSIVDDVANLVVDESAEEESATKSSSKKTQDQKADTLEDDEEDEEAELVKQIQRAQNIVEAWSGTKVFPMLGGPNDALSKPKLANMFDAVFVSTRTAHCLDQPYFTPLLKDGAVVAVESSKFVVPLPRKAKAEFNTKIVDYAKSHGLTRMVPAPVFRRRRDENDLEDDVYFFKYSNAAAAETPATKVTTDSDTR